MLEFNKPQIKVIKMKRLYLSIFASMFLANAFASAKENIIVSEFCSTSYGAEFSECADYKKPENFNYLKGVIVSINKCQSDPNKCGIKVKVATYDTITGDLYIPRVEINTGQGLTFFDANLSLFSDHDGFIFGVQSVQTLDFDDYGFECVVADSILSDFGIDYIDFGINYCDESDILPFDELGAIGNL
jgi:hypothetical protein